MIAQNVSQAELAKRMGIVPQSLTRLVDLSHTTKIDTLANAFAKLGKQLQVGLVWCLMTHHHRRASLPIVPINLTHAKTAMGVVQN